MEAVPLLLSLIALAIVSMDLALAIVWNRRARYTWSRTCVVFTATLLGAVVSFALDQYSYLAFDGTAQAVLHLIWEVLLVLDSTFILGMIPFFCNWVVARPTGKGEKSLAFIAGILYLADSLVWIVTKASVSSILQYVIWTLVVLYCIIVMFSEWKRIMDTSVRTMCRTMVIISFAMLPIVVFSMIFPWLRGISISVVSLSYTIAILVFLFIAIAHLDASSDQDKPVKEGISFEDVQERFHITEREYEVIALIKKGLTNKEIASELNISVNTVNNHIANIFAKTEVRSRIDLLNLLQEASW